jgi:hypothetical protein
VQPEEGAILDKYYHERPYGSRMTPAQIECEPLDIVCRDKHCVERRLASSVSKAGHQGEHYLPIDTSAADVFAVWTGAATIFLAAAFFAAFLIGVLFFPIFTVEVLTAAFLTTAFFRFTGARFALSEDTCELIASFTRAIAAFASRSASRIWDAFDEYRSVTSEINVSILASRLRALFAFIATPLSHVWQWPEGNRQNDRLAFQIENSFDCKRLLIIFGREVCNTAGHIQNVEFAGDASLGSNHNKALSRRVQVPCKGERLKL